MSTLFYRALDKAWPRMRRWLPFNDAGDRLGAYPVEPFDNDALARRCFVCQPAAFVRRTAFAAVGMMNPALCYAMDYDLWIRLARHYRMIKIDAPLAMLRLHASAKTVRQTGRSMAETIGVLRHHFGYVPFNWIYAYGHHRLTGQPVVVDRPRAALVSALYAAALGVRYNWRYPYRLCRDVVTTAVEASA